MFQQALCYILLGEGESALRRTHRILNALVTLPRKTEEVYTGHCEVGQRLAERIGLGSCIQAALGQIYERWDGKGSPHKLKGEAILLPMRFTPAGEIPPTGRRVEVQNAEVYRMKDGKIALLRSYYDVAIMLRQLGLMP